MRQPHVEETLIAAGTPASDGLSTKPGQGVKEMKVTGDPVAKMPNAKPVNPPYCSHSGPTDGHTGLSMQPTWTGRQA